MARMLTEEEVKRLEEQRALQSRAQAAADPNALYNQRMAAAHAAAMERQRGYIERNPNAETNTALRHQVMRDAELRAAHERQKDIMGTEDVTRIEEARQKHLGVENQGVGAATIRAQADKDILGLNLADKEKQRQHELGLLKQNQDFTGAQNTAERQNKLDIAQTQGKSAVDAARAQAEARAAEAAGKLSIEQGKIDARNHATDTRAATAAAGQQNKLLQTIISQKNALGQAVFTKEQQELLAKLLAQ